MKVPSFYYDNSRARYLLLEWFARHADQVGTIELRLPPAELPETWFPDLNIQLSSKDAPLARVIDVSGLNGISVGPGSFSAHISDHQCPWNEGNYRFENAEGTLKISKSDEAECELSIQALSTLIFGTHDPEIFAFRDWGNPTLALQERLRLMFPPQLPYLHERF
jgi:predicted acetyltransferase